MPKSCRVAGCNYKKTPPARTTILQSLSLQSHQSQSPTPAISASIINSLQRRHSPESQESQTIAQNRRAKTGIFLCTVFHLFNELRSAPLPESQESQESHRYPTESQKRQNRYISNFTNILLFNYIMIVGIGQKGKDCAEGEDSARSGVGFRPNAYNTLTRKRKGT